MLKNFFIWIIVISISSNLFPQNLKYFQVHGDTVVIYLSSDGTITTNNKAYYKRVVSFGKKRLAFRGKVTDFYYSNGNIAMKGNYQNGKLNGKLFNYYKNESIKTAGFYKNGKRDSIWYFYYKNGKVEKKVDFSKSPFRLMEFYKKNGKPVFLNGTGFYKGFSNINYSSCELYPIKGNVKNGLMTGRWTLTFKYGETTEVFENGVFMNGFETPFNRIYKSHSMINPAGFPYYENISLLNYSIAWKNIKKDFYFWPAYNINVNIEQKTGFLYDLRQSIKENLGAETSPFFYALIEFKIEKGIVKPNSFKSVTNNKKLYEKVKRIILSLLDKWHKPKDKISFTFYLPIFWENGLIYLKPNDMSNFN